MNFILQQPTLVHLGLDPFAPRGAANQIQRKHEAEINRQLKAVRMGMKVNRQGMPAPTLPWPWLRHIFCRVQASSIPPAWAFEPCHAGHAGRTRTYIPLH